MATCEHEQSPIKLPEKYRVARVVEEMVLSNVSGMFSATEAALQPYWQAEYPNLTSTKPFS